MNQQRITLIFIIVVSAIATIAINEVDASKGTGWFDNRDFYKKVKSLDVFDEYPYEKEKLTVKVVHVSDTKIKRDFIVQYGKDTLVIEKKEFKKDKNAKVQFYIDDDEKNKVCMMSFADEYEKCKKFNDKRTVTFYIQ